MTFSAKLLSLLRRAPLTAQWVHRWYMQKFMGATAGLSRQQIFEKYFHDRWWRSPETRSGHGSSVAYTENIRREIPRLLERIGAQTILDAPCGDFNWFQHVQLPRDTRYIGGDIVREIVAENRRKFEEDGRSFRHIDIINDRLPAADIWLARAVLNHFSDADIWATLQNFMRSDIRYLLTSNYPAARSNRDIPTGFYRSLNLLRPPFSFPKPLETIADGMSSGEPVELCLWERKMLADVVAQGSKTS